MLTLFFITVNVFWALTFIYLVRSDPGVVQPNNLSIEVGVNFFLVSPMLLEQF